jgi:hypothetical protein
LKSPTTDTPRAFGAQTTNEYPATPSMVAARAPIFSHARSQ